jgi:putative ABC transport system substrate-binding protein
VVRRELTIVQATTEQEIESGFVTLVQRRVGAPLVAQDPFFVDRREQIVALTNNHKLPAIYYQREFPAIGGQLRT